MILQYKWFSNKMKNSTFAKMFFFVQIFYNNDPIEKSSWQKFLNTILQILSRGFFKIIICIGVLYNFMLLRHFWGILSNQSSTWYSVKSEKNSVIHWNNSVNNRRSSVSYGRNSVKCTNWQKTDKSMTESLSCLTETPQIMTEYLRILTETL